MISQIQSDRKSQLKTTPVFFTQLSQNPRLHEVCIMLSSAFEKLLQTMEYAVYHVQDDLEVRQVTHTSQSLGFEETLLDEIDNLRTTVMLSTFYSSRRD